jgi:spermidine/putrescine transport system permease protein
MTATLERETTAPASAPRRRPRRRVADRLLFGFTWLIILWLALPIFVMILFGFNDTKGRYNQTWQGFTFKWYGRLLEIPALTDAVINSLIIAVGTMVVAGAIGTLVGIALGRYRFRGHGTMNLVMFAVIASPELVMGASLLSLFVTFDVGRGLITILIAHVMFSISFVAVVVRPGADPGPLHRGGGAGSRCRTVDHIPAGDLADDLPGGPLRGAAGLRAVH